MRYCLWPLLLLLACRHETPPDYVRVAGPAPELAGSPAGAATLVVFWAAWCEPCRRETPSLRRLAVKPPSGIQLVVISQDESMEAVSRFLGGPPPAAWRLRLDPGRRLFEAFRGDTLPVSFLVVRGQLVARFGGVRDWTSRGMTQLLERLAGEAGGGVP